MNKRILVVCVCICCCFSAAQAQQLVYKPVNPAFGGDTFNYQWLLASAQAQNRFNQGLQTSNPLQDFSSNLNKQILNQLSQKIVSQIFGEGNMKDGTYQYGPFSVAIQSLYDGISVTIGSSDGGKTIIKVPYY